MANNFCNALSLSALRKRIAKEDESAVAFH